MKANFWQILGVILLVIGLAGYVYEKFVAAPAPAKPAPVLSPTTVPSTLPIP